MSDIKSITDYLRKYNAWRRGEDSRTMDEAGIVPAELGQMIDASVGSLEWQAARAQGDSEPVGIATACRVNRAATVARFPVNKVPIGTKLYSHPPKAQAVPEPDMFWDADDAEQFGGSDAQEFSDTVGCDMSVGQSMVVRVQCAVQLPNRWMKITAPDETTTQWEWVQPPQEGSGYE